MADIFEEVEEGLRQDRAERLWKKYGVFAYIAAALLIGGVALNQFLTNRQADTIEANAVAFESASEALLEKDYTTAATGYEALATSKARIAPMAANYLAEVRLAGNADRQAAIAALESAADSSTPVGKLSLMKAAYLKSDGMTRAETETYLGDLMTEESQFGALALELVAAKAVEEGDYEFARTALNDLRFLANVPQGVQQRATAALNALPATSLASDETETDTSDSQSDAGPVTADDGAEAAGADATDGDQPE